MPRRRNAKMPLAYLIERHSPDPFIAARNHLTGLRRTLDGLRHLIATGGTVQYAAPANSDDMAALVKAERDIERITRIYDRALQRRLERLHDLAGSPPSLDQSRALVQHHKGPGALPSGRTVDMDKFSCPICGLTHQTAFDTDLSRSNQRDLVAAHIRDKHPWIRPKGER